MAEAEMGLDDFELDSSSVKSVGAIKTEDLDQRSGVTNSDGETHTISKLEKEIISKLDEQADKILEEIVKSSANSKEMKDITNALSRMGDKEVSETSNMSSRMLQRPIRSMRSGGSDKNVITDNLKDLRNTVTRLDPSKRNGVFTKRTLLKFIPFGIGNKVDNYFQEYKSAETHLEEIIKGLYNGKDELFKDNAEIDVERENMQTLMGRLEQYAYIMKKLDKKISDKLPQIKAEDQIKATDIENEILFPVRQKRMDLLQHMAVCMQGYMALGVVRKNNVELIRGVDRATKTTMAALRTAVMVSEALGTQKLVLDQITAVNQMTNSFIEQNSKMLREQGTIIQKQATESSVNVEVLNKAFQDIFKSMDAIDKFRIEALPKMKATADSLEKTLEGAKGYLQAREKNAVDFTKEISEEKKENSKVVNIMKA